MILTNGVDGYWISIKEWNKWVNNIYINIDLLTFALVNSYSTSNKGCFARNETLLKKMKKMSLRTLQYSLKRLIEGGSLTREEVKAFVNSTNNKQLCKTLSRTLKLVGDEPSKKPFDKVTQIRVDEVQKEEISEGENNCTQGVGGVQKIAHKVNIYYNKYEKIYTKSLLLRNISLVKSFSYLCTVLPTVNEKQLFLNFFSELDSEILKLEEILSLQYKLIHKQANLYPIPHSIPHGVQTNTQAVIQANEIKPVIKSKLIRRSSVIKQEASPLSVTQDEASPQLFIKQEAIPQVSPQENNLRQASPQLFINHEATPQLFIKQEATPQLFIKQEATPQLFIKLEASPPVSPQGNNLRQVDDISLIKHEAIPLASPQGNNLRQATPQLLIENEATPQVSPQGSSPRPRLSTIIKNGMATFVTQAELNAKPPATKEAPFLSKNVTLIVNEWEDGLKIHNHTTKTFKQAIININKLLRGKMFNYTTEFKDYKNKAFTVDEICASIANFKLAALSQDYAPQGSLKDSFRDTAFADFFYNSHARKNKSLFIQFFNNPPKSVIETGRLIADVYPHLSHKLRQLYVENVLGDPDAKLTPQSENAFRRAAMRLSSFMSEHKHRIIINEVNGNLANYLWQALEQKVISVTKITPYWFNSDKTFLEVLPAYLYDQGVLSTMNKPTFNMYDYGSKVTPAPTVEDYYD